jgi:hypothetical protein
MKKQQVIYGLAIVISLPIAFWAFERPSGSKHVVPISEAQRQTIRQTYRDHMTMVGDADKLFFGDQPEAALASYETIEASGNRWNDDVLLAKEAACLERLGRYPDSLTVLRKAFARNNRPQTEAEMAFLADKHGDKVALNAFIVDAKSRWVDIEEPKDPRDLWPVQNRAWPTNTDARTYLLFAMCFSGISNLAGLDWAYGHALAASGNDPDVQVEYAGELWWSFNEGRRAQAALAEAGMPRDADLIKERESLQAILKGWSKGDQPAIAPDQPENLHRQAFADHGIY